MDEEAWLLLYRLAKKDGSELDLNNVFHQFQFENLEGGTENHEINLEWFSKYLRAVFSNVVVKRKTINGKQIRIIENIKLKCLPNLNREKIDFDKLEELIPRFVVMKKREKSVLTCSVISGCKSNGNDILKSVSFNLDGTWQLSVGGKNVDLYPLFIDPTYQCEKDNILSIFHAIQILKVCEGVTAKASQSVICTRFHTTELFQNESNENRDKIFKLRSALCDKIIPLLTRNNICVHCRKMTFTEKGKNINVLQEETCSPEKDTDIIAENFKKIIPNAPKEMIMLLVCQAKNMMRNPNGYRWPKKIIATCLQLYDRSPAGYDSLRNSKMLKLPSPSLLILYKSSVKQKIGFKEKIFQWMRNEAVRLKIPAEGFFGGIILDEMAIQEDLQIQKTTDGVELVGFVDKGEEANICSTLREGEKKQKIRKHILQFVFLGLTGFRFPFAHFVTDEVRAYDLHALFWEAVDKLQMHDFTCCFTSMDGACCNRTFLNINIISPGNMIVPSPCNFEEKVIFTMDYSHVMKKIRNNILKSGVTKGCTRNLTLSGGEMIQWQMFQDCYHWDQKNALEIHCALTNEHFYPSTSSKMRNHLAEDVLDDRMLHLFQMYQSSLRNGQSLNGVIQLLQKTSKLVQIFRDVRPIQSTDDPRLRELMSVKVWFEQWKIGAKSSKDLFSRECNEDIESCINGFIKLCNYLLRRKDVKIFITPALVNSDVVENTFCQQRSTYNGPNSNPNALEYRRNLNSIVLGQRIVSKKANASVSNGHHVQPYTFSKPGPLKRKSSEKMPLLRPKSIRI